MEQNGWSRGCVCSITGGVARSWFRCARPDAGVPSVPLDGARSVSVINASPHLPAARLLQAVLPNGVPAFLVDCPALYKRGGGPYQNEQGADFPDNAQRFAQLCRVAVHMASDDESAWRPQVVHCNDWQSGLVPAYFHFAPRSATPTVLTIHNLAFQGMFPASTLDLVDLPRESFSINGADSTGNYRFSRRDWLTPTR